MPRTILLLSSGLIGVVAATPAAAANSRFAERCAALAESTVDGVNQALFRPIVRAPSGPPMAPSNPAGMMIPAHCEVQGLLEQRIGIDGQHYAIRYHLRLPENWNGRFFFQGGAGTNGVLGDALGSIGAGRPPAIVLGYAVVSQDSGHDNRLNNDPARGGETVFGGDPQARADYGGKSLKRVADAAKAVVARFYGKPAARSYFFGCSKGGQEGMALAQRYPTEFDGIVAGAPGFALPRAALAQIWDVQTYGALVRQPGDSSVDFRKIPAAFSDAQLALVRQAVLAACDADDGAKDGIVARFDRCTTAKVMPELKRITCTDQSGHGCVSPAQVAALLRSLGGPRDKSDNIIYASWPWDGGIGTAGWRLWKLGTPMMPSLNVLTGAPALAMIFTVPPTPVHADPQSFVDYEMAFDFATDADKIYATSAVFRRSAWTDISARSTDLSAFRAHGGKMIVPQGASDPVFSINDTIAWYRELQAKTRGAAPDFVRLFAVPGMAHCGGGVATDSFDSFAALVDWVEHGRAPDRIEAMAGPGTPWPGRTRPLCPFPQAATYTGKGSIEDGNNFACKG